MAEAAAPGFIKTTVSHTDFINSSIQKRINGIARAIENRFRRRIKALEKENESLKTKLCFPSSFSNPQITVQPIGKENRSEPVLPKDPVIHKVIQEPVIRETEINVVRKEIRNSVICEPVIREPVIRELLKYKEPIDPPFRNEILEPVFRKENCEPAIRIDNPEFTDDQLKAIAYFIFEHDPNIEEEKFMLTYKTIEQYHIPDKYHRAIIAEERPPCLRYNKKSKSTISEFDAEDLALANSNLTQAWKEEMHNILQCRKPPRLKKSRQLWQRKIV
jgi:hypothetical protein